MRKTDHKVANDYSGKEKRHTDFWGNPPEQIVNILWNIKSGIFLWKSIDTHMQSHIDSIHSPQRTRKTIMKLCMKSVKFHLGIIFWGNRSTLSEKVKLWKWKYSFKNASISGGTAPYCLEKWKWKDCFKVASFSEGIKKSIVASFSEENSRRCLKKSADFPGRSPPKNLSHIVWSKIHHCAFISNLCSFCRTAACPWRRRWRWWYRGRKWGFPEHQWFSP